MTPTQHPPELLAESFGLPPSTPILAAKLRNLPPDLLASIRTTKVESHE